MPLKTPSFLVRPPEVTDGSALRDLVRQCPPLEVNTGYAYLLLATHFAASSAVAVDEKGLVGFVLGYRLPADPSVWFVWQVGVHGRARGAGLGRMLLRHVLDRPDFGSVRYLEATIAPSNLASRRLFEGFAREREVACEALPYFEPTHFGDGNHEAESLFRIGPFRPMSEQSGE